MDYRRLLHNRCHKVRQGLIFHRPKLGWLQKLTAVLPHFFHLICQKHGYFSIQVLNRHRNVIHAVNHGNHAAWRILAEAEAPVDRLGRCIRDKGAFGDFVQDLNQGFQGFIGNPPRRGRDVDHISNAGHIPADIHFSRFHYFRANSGTPIPGCVHSGEGVSRNGAVTHAGCHGRSEFLQRGRILHPEACVTSGFPYVIKVFREADPFFSKIVLNENIGKIESILLHRGKLLLRGGLHIVLQIPQQLENLMEFFSGSEGNKLSAPDFHANHILR